MGAWIIEGMVPGVSDPAVHKPEQTIDMRFVEAAARDLAWRRGHSG
jgi:hypothetical protein